MKEIKAKDSVLQVRMDSYKRKQAEELFANLGTTLPEAVRIFIYASIAAKGFPFELRQSIFPSGPIGKGNDYADPSKAKEEAAYFKAMLAELK